MEIGTFFFFVSSRQVAKIRKKNKQEQKRWTAGLLWGHWFRVWSPNPKTVFLHVEQVYIALEKSLHRGTEGGICMYSWRTSSAEIGPGIFYLSAFFQLCVWEEVVDFSFLFCGVYIASLSSSVSDSRSISLLEGRVQELGSTGTCLDSRRRKRRIQQQMQRFQ